MAHTTRQVKYTWIHVCTYSLHTPYCAIDTARAACFNAYINKREREREFSLRFMPQTAAARIIRDFRERERVRVRVSIRVRCSG